MAEPVDQLDLELTRARVLLLGMVTALILLGAALWRVQVLHTDRYASRLEQQSMRRVRLPGARGVIRDRNGEALADNRPSYGLAVYLEELRQRGRASNTVNRIEEVVDRLSGVLGLARQVTRKDIVTHMVRRCPLPLLAWKDVDEVALARWAEHDLSFAGVDEVAPARWAEGRWTDRDLAFPGVDVAVEPVRRYPRASLAAHVLGFVGRLEPDANELYHFYLPDMEGRDGLEKALNVRLAGVAGGELIRVDVAGYKYRTEAGRDPIPGSDVQLTLDARIQGFLEEALAGTKGAGVILDPRNGDVLAMASSPTFCADDLRQVEAYRRLEADPDKPLFNRAVCGLYPPGSTFKPLVALAALESGRATERTVFECPGYFEIGNRRFNCFHQTVHGELALRGAIEQSCNVYFYQLGQQCGPECVSRMARELGLGQATGIEIRGEAAGLVPDPAWQGQRRRAGWRGGDTCNLYIGQGALLVTPLQMAVLAATIGNGGWVYRPRLVRPGGPAPARGEACRRMKWSAAALSVVRGGMRDVVQSAEGTGRNARIDGVAMAGKTGSAEYDEAGARKVYGWMIVFAPYDQPRYALALVIADAESGGATAAPRVRELMRQIFAMELDEARVAREGRS
jgi:penicillin-binding protein 2